MQNGVDFPGFGFYAWIRPLDRLQRKLCSGVVEIWQCLDHPLVKRTKTKWWALEGPQASFRSPGKVGCCSDVAQQYFI